MIKTDKFTGYIINEKKMYAIIEFAGKQYKVEEGSNIRVPRLNGEIGTKVPIDRILYLEDGSKKTIGSPFVLGKKMNSEIISHGRGQKVVVFKFKRRKGSQKKNTHRDEYTILKLGKLTAQKKQEATKKKVSTDKKKIVAKKENTKKVATKKPVTKSMEKEKE